MCWELNFSGNSAKTTRLIELNFLPSHHQNEFQSLWSILDSNQCESGERLLTLKLLCVFGFFFLMSLYDPSPLSQ